MVLGWELVDATTKKLFCELFNPCNKMHAFMAFVQHVLLELVHSDVASLIAIDGVQKHMQILLAARQGSL